MSLMCVCCRSTGRLRVAKTFFSVLERLVAQVCPQIFFSRTLEKLGRMCDQIGRTLEPCQVWRNKSKLIDGLIDGTNRERRKGSRDIRLSRVSRIAAVASSTPDTAMTRLVSTGILQPPIHLENRFETLMNVDEESQNMTKLGSNQPAANIATNRRSRSSRRQHSAQSAAEPRTLIVGDSIIRNVRTRTATTCCFPQATVSDVNKELRSIVMKHKTANRVIIHVGKNDIRKGQSELLKQDFSELFDTLQRLEVQSFISGPLPARGTNMFSRLIGLNTWLQRTCSTKGVKFIDNFNIFWGHRQLFKLDGLHPNKFGTRVLKDNFYFSLRHPSVVCANPLIHSPGQNMSDHRTSYQLPSYYVVEESHKDTDNATQPKQALLMDIPAEPCP